MAFKMKGWSGFQNSPMKQGLDIEKQLEIVDAEIINAEIKKFDQDKDGNLNDKERLMLIESHGLTKEEVSAEYNRLAEEYGDDDLDLMDWVQMVVGISKIHEGDIGDTPATPLEQSVTELTHLSDEEILDGYRNSRADFFAGDKSAKDDITLFYNEATKRKLNVTDVERESQSEWYKEQGLDDPYSKESKLGMEGGI
tara:strand:+ start:923 stop:1513 length:591 start_codon:yes stop_codon:yes gene_type:complete